MGGIEVTKKTEPEKNALQLGGVRLAFLWDALLRAKFVVTEKPYDLLRTAWARVREAEKAGTITRSHRAEVERYIGPTSVEVYVSLD